MKSQTQIPTIDQIRELLAPALRESSAKKAIVFGSYARGDADEYSDLDLIVVADSERKFITRFKDFPGIIEAWYTWRKGLDLLIYTPEEISQMQSRGNPFIERALEEGVTIYEE